MAERIIKSQGYSPTDIAYLFTEGEEAQLAVKNEWVRDYILDLMEKHNSLDNAFLAPNGKIDRFMPFIREFKSSVAIIDSLSDISDNVDEECKTSRIQENDYGYDQARRLSYSKNRTTLQNVVETLLTTSDSHRICTIRLNSSLMVESKSIEQAMVLIQKYKYLSDIAVYIDRDTKIAGRRKAKIIKARSRKINVSESPELDVDDLADWIFKAIAPALDARMPNTDPLLDGWGVKDRGFYRQLIRRCASENIDLKERVLNSGKEMVDEFFVEGILFNLEKNPHYDDSWVKQIAWLKKKGFNDVLDEMKKIDSFSAKI